MTKTTHTYEITNLCTCTVYNEETDEYTDEPTEHCFGDCWDMATEDFGMLTEDFRNSNVTGWWKVTDLALWNRTSSGFFHADPNDVGAILYGMTVNSAWTMRYNVFPDRIEYSLSHHDAMGSATTLTAVSMDERDEMGLYR